MSLADNQEAIKPCPFCGIDVLGVYWDRWTNPKPQAFIFCDDCGCNGPRKETEELALQAWNKRAVQTSYQDLSDCIFDPSFRVLGFSFAVLNELRRQLMLRMCDMEPVTVDGVKKALAIEAWNRRA